MRILDLKNNVKIEDLYMISQVQREYIIQNCDILEVRKSDKYLTPTHVYKNNYIYIYVCMYIEIVCTHFLYV